MEEAVASELRLVRAVLANAPIIIYAMDLNQVFTFSEGLGLAAIGVKPGQVVGQSAALLYGDTAFVDASGTAEVGRQIFDRVLRGEAYSGTSTVGDTIHDNKLRPVRDEAGRITGLIGIATDITESRKAVAALRESEERFRVAFRTIPDAVNIGRVSDGVNIAVNEGFCRLTGWPEAEATGVSATALGIWPDAAVRDALMAKLARQGYVRDEEVRFRARDGSEFIGLVSSQLFSIGGKPCFLTVTHDITERRRAERARTAVYSIAESASAAGTLQEMLKEIHRTIAGLMPVPNFYIALYDEAEGTLSFPYFVDSEDAQQPKTAPPGKGLTAWVLRSGQPLLLNDEAEFQAFFRAAGVEALGAPSASWMGVPLRSGERTFGVLAAQIYAGQTRYGQRDLELFQFVSTQLARAIERKQGDEALRESERRFRALIQHSSDGTMVVSARGEVIFGSASMRQILGYPDVAALGPMPGYIHPDDLSRFEAAWRGVLEKPGVPIFTSARVRHLDGSFRILDGVCVNLLSDPALRGVVVNLRDVTERNQLQAQLMAADRMVSIGTLAAGMAHEINNPLAYVIANLTLAAEALQAAGPFPLKDAVAAAQDGAERIRQIVRSLKTFSRAPETSFGAVDVNQVVDTTANIAQNEILHRARLERDYGSRLPRARANEGQLGQVVLNLLVNAAQAMPEGHDREKLITVSTGARDGWVVIEVKDTGSGIAPEHLPRLFDPFFTTKPVGVGTGLGLYICQQLVASMGGLISVESEVGRGSTFRVSLPGAGEAPAQAASPAAPAEAVKEVRGRILTVDDEPLITSVLQHTLKAHEVTALNSASAALAQIRGGKRFDLILCDLMMPGMTGMDLHEALAREQPGQARRMIFLTGGAFTQRAREFLDGVDGEWVEKPFEVAAMRALITKALARLGRA